MDTGHAKRHDAYISGSFEQVELKAIRHEVPQYVRTYRPVRE
jgi:hypothetical protein